MAAWITPAIGIGWHAPCRSEPVSHYYYSDRLKLQFWDWGQDGKPSLLLVHGGLDHARNWDWVARSLQIGTCFSLLLFRSAEVAVLGLGSRRQAIATVGAWRLGSRPQLGLGGTLPADRNLFLTITIPIG